MSDANVSDANAKETSDYNHKSRALTSQKPLLIRLAKLLVAISVIIAVSWQIYESVGAFNTKYEMNRIHFEWIAVAIALYIIGLFSFGLYYARILRSRHPITSYPLAISAYFLSQLGKYVPGKASVVLIRASLSAASGIRPVTAVLATLYETVVMMAAGCLVALAGFLISPTGSVAVRLGAIGVLNLPLAGLAALLTLPFLVVVNPLIFVKLVHKLTSPFSGMGPDALPRLSQSLLGEGLVWSLLGWILLGFSQIAVIRGLSPVDVSTVEWPAVVASVALATVAGFAIPVVPGGLGVREWVLWTSLSTVLDREASVVAALALRLCWIGGELLLALCAYSFIIRAKKRINHD